MSSTRDFWKTPRRCEATRRARKKANPHIDERSPNRNANELSPRPPDTGCESGSKEEQANDVCEKLSSDPVNKDSSEEKNFDASQPVSSMCETDETANKANNIPDIASNVADEEQNGNDDSSEAPADVADDPNTDSNDSKEVMPDLISQPKMQSVTESSNTEKEG